EVRTDPYIRDGRNLVRHHGYEIGGRRSVVRNQRFVDVGYHFEPRRLVVERGVQGRIATGHRLHVRDDPRLDHIARVSEGVVGADGDRLADRGRLGRLSRRDERRIRWRTVRLRRGEITRDDLEGRDEDATIGERVVGGNSRFVVGREGDAVGAVRHSGGTVAEGQCDLDDVPRVVGPSVRDGVDQVIVPERRRLSDRRDEYDVAACGNEGGPGRRKGLVEHERPERARRPKRIGIRGGGWSADLNREEALGVVRGLPIA